MTASLHSDIPELRPMDKECSSRVHSPDCLALNARGSAIRGILSDLYVELGISSGRITHSLPFEDEKAGGKSVMSGYYYCMAHTWMMDPRLVCVHCRLEPSPCLTNARAGGSNNGSVPGWGLILGPSVHCQGSVICIRVLGNGLLPIFLGNMRTTSSSGESHGEAPNTRSVERW
jgi:hypothetical protein